MLQFWQRQCCSDRRPTEAWKPVRSSLWLPFTFPVFPPVRSRLASRAADVVLGGGGEVPGAALAPGVAVRAPAAVHRGGAADHALPAGRRLRPGGSQQPGCQCRGRASARGLGSTAGKSCCWAGMGALHTVGIASRASSGSKQRLCDAVQRRLRAGS